MPWTIIAISSAISLIVGILIGRFARSDSESRQKLSYQLNNSRQELENYKREVSEHLLATKSILKQAQDNYLSLVEQMESTNKLIHVESKQEKQATPYSGKQPDADDDQPKDYAGTQHGLIKQFDTKEGV